MKEKCQNCRGTGVKAPEGLSDVMIVLYFIVIEMLALEMIFLIISILILIGSRYEYISVLITQKMGLLLFLSIIAIFLFNRLRPSRPLNLRSRMLGRCLVCNGSGLKA